MKLNRPIPRAQTETIVTLIDVVFFLLVFFLLVGRMDATAPFDVVPPTGTTGTDMPAGGMTIAVDSDGTLAVDGRLLSRDEVVARVQDRLLTDPALLIRVNADKSATLRHVLPLVAELEHKGARDVVLVITPNPP